jgi:anti-sigma-K factor RskA
METAEIHTLTGAYAAGALEDDELAEFERHLGACPACREEVHGLRETIAVLAEATAVTPPARVRAAVLGALRTTAQDRPRPVATHRSAEPVRRRPGGSWLAAAAVLVAFTVGSGGFAVAEYRSAQDARAQLAAVAAVVADPAAHRVDAAVAGGGSASLFVSGSRAALVAASMRGLPDGRVYQLWVVRPKVVTSAGLGPAGGAAAGAWQALVDGVRAGDVVAVSVEPSGGSAQPTTTPVVTLRA